MSLASDTGADMKARWAVVAALIAVSVNAEAQSSGGLPEGKGDVAAEKAAQKARGHTVQVLYKEENASYATPILGNVLRCAVEPYVAGANEIAIAHVDTNCSAIYETGSIYGLYPDVGTNTIIGNGAHGVTDGFRRLSLSRSAAIPLVEKTEYNFAVRLNATQASTCDCSLVVQVVKAR